LIPEYAGYFDFISVVALLFAAYVGPELLIPDRVQGVLNVYFSRPLSIYNYLAAKLGAYAAIILSFWLVPQLVYHLALAGLSSQGFLSYLVDTTDVLWKIPLAASVYFLTHASLATLISTFLNRVGAAAGVFLAGLLGLNIVAVFFLDATDAPGGRFATLLAIEQHPRYVRDWIFGVDSLEHIPEAAGFGPGVSLAVIFALAIVSGVVLVWRYRRLP
jgi:ABC-2 type transport system permease protein